MLITSADVFSAIVQFPRWFSINQVFEELHQEFWAFRMILRHSQGDGPPDVLESVEDPARLMHKDPKKELQALKSSAGGLVLAERLLTPWLHNRIRIYCYGTKACWTWYTEQVKHVKTPAEGLAYSIRMAKGGWQEELRRTFQEALEVERHLVELGLDWNAAAHEVAQQQSTVAVLVDFCCKLNANRAWSQMVHESPPHAYAGLLSREAVAKGAAMERLRRDLSALISLEQKVHTDPAAQQAFQDCRDLFSAPVRLLMAVCERDKFRVDSVTARRQLATILLVLPDTKCVEDCHQHLRDLQRKGRSLVSSKTSRARAVMNSGVLESRGVPHRLVLKSEYVAGVGGASAKLGALYNPRKVPLSRRWSTILGQRSWTSTTPESFRKALAAWHWTVEWLQLPAGTRPAFDTARFSAWLPPGEVLQRRTETRAYLGLGSAAWGSLLYTLTPGPTCPGGAATWLLQGAVEWCHATDLTLWTVLPSEACSPLKLQQLAPGTFPFKVFLRQTGAPVPVMRFVLARPISLSLRDLQRVAAWLALRSSGAVAQLAERIADALSQNDAPATRDAFLGEVAEAVKGKVPSTIALDPVTEAAFVELDPEDKKEFNIIAEKIAKANQKRKVSQWKQERAGKKKRRRKDSHDAVGTAGASEAAVPGVVASSGAASSSSAAPPVSIAPPVAVLYRGRHPHTFDWGRAPLLFHFTFRSGALAGWQVRCAYHAAEASKTGPGMLPCTREMRLLSDAVDDIRCLRSLKQWCIGADLAADRQEHMSVHNFPRGVPADLPEEAALDDALEKMLASLRGATQVVGCFPLHCLLVASALCIILRRGGGSDSGASS